MSPEALAKPIITKNSSEFKLDAYASIPAGELVVFTIQVLQADAAPVAVEEVVSTCFRLFPHSFALKNYFYWPDSALVSRRLHDAKEKGLLKGNPTDGYETKGSGKQTAKQVAKTLGVSLPVPPKVEVSVPLVEKKEEVSAETKDKEKKEVAPSAPVVKIVKKSETKKKETQKKAAKPEQNPVMKKKVQAKPKRVVAKPFKKKLTPKPKTQQKAAPKKTTKQVKQKAGKPALKPKSEMKPTAKKVEKAVAKKPVTSKKDIQPKAKPVVKKVEPKVEKKVEKKEAKAQPTQLTMSLNPPAAWKKAETPATKPNVKKEALPVKGEVLAPVAVSKEEKDKAAKVIKQIERSDAYQLYRRNGKRAQIGEFDFRNMLFATMESSAETLKRNVGLFKRYAGIHFRTDLIAFLEFCEENFSALLISKVKGKK